MMLCIDVCMLSARRGEGERGEERGERREERGERGVRKKGVDVGLMDHPS